MFLYLLARELLAKLRSKYNSFLLLRVKVSTLLNKLLFVNNKEKFVKYASFETKATLKGAEETYGPDFTYDAFIWKKGKWQGKSDVDIRSSHNTDGQKITPVKDSELRK